MSDIEDQDIIAAILKGDREKFAVLIDRYQNHAFNMCMRILKDRDMAAEVCHVAFIKVYENLGRFKKGSKFSTWLYRITYNECITQIRSNKRHLATDFDHLPDGCEGFDINLGILSLKKADQEYYLKAALDQLKPNEAYLIQAYYINQLDISELEEITGLSQSNIKVKLFRARKLIYQFLKTAMGQEMNTLIEHA